ncbi:MAG: hypothetical protein KDJ75_03535 [Alphaproteobacteria bacterium]|nr:hypothetical protein [Alphaproteobacteria bacterium]
MSRVRRYEKSPLYFLADIKKTGESISILFNGNSWTKLRLQKPGVGQKAHYYDRGNFFPQDISPDSPIYAPAQVFDKAASKSHKNSDRDAVLSRLRKGGEYEITVSRIDDDKAWEFGRR